jgi:excisionase family DNA binding protein
MWYMCIMSKGLSTAEAASAVGIGRVTLQRWIRRGQVKAPKMVIRNGRALRLWFDRDIARLRKLVGTFKPGPEPKVKKAR